MSDVIKRVASSCFVAKLLPHKWYNNHCLIHVIALSAAPDGTNPFNGSGVGAKVGDIPTR